MKVGLIQLDGKWENLALLKLSTFYKNKGDEVVYLDLSGYNFDLTFASKVFVGGSGYSLESKLPEDIESVVPDYELFNMDKTVGFTSRGCIRDCNFCIVREKEGNIKEVREWKEQIKHSKVLLFDNNFLASPNWKEKLRFFIDNKIKVCFTQGLDIRLLNNEKAEMLSKVKYYDNKFNRRVLYFAWDNIGDEEQIKKGVKILEEVGIPLYRIYFYVLIGFDSTFEEDYYRVQEILNMGCKPYIMRYHTKDYKLNEFARWINRRYYQLFDWITYFEYRKKNRKRK